MGSHSLSYPLRTSHGRAVQVSFIARLRTVTKITPFSALMASFRPLHLLLRLSSVTSTGLGNLRRKSLTYWASWLENVLKERRCLMKVARLWSNFSSSLAY